MTKVPWVALALLGALHGINPAMGWLFAVSLGLQERDRGAVMRAMGPIAAGHAVSIALFVGVFLAASSVVAGRPLRIGAAVILIGFGVFKLLRPFKHPRWARMRVGGGQLAVWSFLMASAHGAGLMLLPALGPIASNEVLAGDAHVALAGKALSSFGPAALAVGVHTAGMLLVALVVAILVYDRLGVAVLRSTWVNVDILWAGALVLAGIYVLALGLGT